MVIHGEPPPWRKKVKFVGPRLDFEGSIFFKFRVKQNRIFFLFCKFIDEHVNWRIRQISSVFLCALYVSTLLLRIVQIFIASIVPRRDKENRII